MLRRVEPALRGSLLVIGLLIWSSLPLTFFYSASVGFDARGKGHAILSWSGAIVWNSASDISYRNERYRIREMPTVALDASLAIYPQIGFNGDQKSLDGISFPLWLLAVLCLAWPVTSFLLARRRRRPRGFDVEVSGAERGVMSDE